MPETVECPKCRVLVEMISAGGREYAFDAESGELHECWEALPDGADFLSLG